MKKIRFKDLDGNAQEKKIFTFYESVLSPEDTEVRGKIAFRVSFTNADGTLSSYPVDSDTNRAIIKAHIKYSKKQG